MAAAYHNFILGGDQLDRGAANADVFMNFIPASDEYAHVVSLPDILLIVLLYITKSCLVEHWCLVSWVSRGDPVHRFQIAT